MTPEIEPMMPSDAALASSDLREKARELDIRAARLFGHLSPITARVITETLRVINSYYSNMIEGNNTSPADIRKASRGEFLADARARNYQIESNAHVEVQAVLAEEDIDADRVVSCEFIAHIHQLFFDRIPDELKVLEDGSRVIPGQIRVKEVTIGRHLAPSFNTVPRLLQRYTEAYSARRIGAHPIIGIMAAHHRLAYIHPFLDGNGRAIRLLTDEMLRAHGVGGVGIWCMSRGLARSARHPTRTYKAMLDAADAPRKGDRDGRGALSERALVNFIDFMIEVAIDQVDYMAQLIATEGARARIDSYINRRNDGLIVGLGPIKPAAGRILKEAFAEGELARSDVADIAGMNANTVRKLIQQMKAEGLLSETSSRSPLRLAIPEHFESYLLPGLAG